MYAHACVSVRVYECVCVCMRERACLSVLGCVFVWAVFLSVFVSVYRCVCVCVCVSEERKREENTKLEIHIKRDRELRNLNIKSVRVNEVR